MKIGIMLRAIDEKGGVGVYARNIVQELLKLNSGHEFVLFYRQPTNLGLFADRDDVTELHVPGRNKIYWDQVVIPKVCRAAGVDLLFHPKFTAPFLAPCPVVMVVHGADWFMPDQHQFYSWLDVRYIRTIMPLYFRKCSRVISVSKLTTENFYSALNLPEGKLKTIYFGPAAHFTRVNDLGHRRAILQKYDLPQQYLLTLTKLTGDRRKNLSNLLAGYAHYHEIADEPLPLVVGGQDCEQLREQYKIPFTDYGADIIFPGWLDQMDLPAIYSQATAFIYPSNLEAFPIPLTEAMACGTPFVTSDVNGLREIGGDAGLFVPPADVVAIGQAIKQLAESPVLQKQLKEKGLARSLKFDWRRCAEETLAVLAQSGAGNLNQPNSGKALTIELLPALIDGVLHE